MKSHPEDAQVMAYYNGARVLAMQMASEESFPAEIAEACLPVCSQLNNVPSPKVDGDDFLFVSSHQGQLMDCSNDSASSKKPLDKTGNSTTLATNQKQMDSDGLLTLKHDAPQGTTTISQADKKQMDEDGLVKSSYRKGWALGRKIFGFKKIGFGHQLLLKSTSKPATYELVPASQCNRSAYKDYISSSAALNHQEKASISKETGYEDLMGLMEIAYSSTTKDRLSEPPMIYVKWATGEKQWVTRSALQIALSKKIVVHEISIYEDALCQPLGSLKGKPC